MRGSAPQNCGRRAPACRRPDKRDAGPTPKGRNQRAYSRPEWKRCWTLRPSLCCFTHFKNAHKAVHTSFHLSLGVYSAVLSKIAHSGAKDGNRALAWQRQKSLLTIWPFRVLITAEEKRRKYIFAPLLLFIVFSGVKFEHPGKLYILAFVSLTARVVRAHL